PGAVVADPSERLGLLASRGGRRLAAGAGLLRGSRALMDCGCVRGADPSDPAAGGPGGWCRFMGAVLRHWLSGVFARGTGQWTRRAADAGTASFGPYALPDGLANRGCTRATGERVGAGQ